MKLARLSQFIHNYKNTVIMLDPDRKDPDDLKRLWHRRFTSGMEVHVCFRSRRCRLNRAFSSEAESRIRYLNVTTKQF